MFVTVTRYSSSEPGSAGPPPTTTTCFVIVSCCASPTTTTVGSGPVAGLPSPSVSRSGASLLPTTAWLLISVPPGTPAFTSSRNWITALWPASSAPIAMPAASGETPPSGCPTGAPFSVVVFATYVVFAGTESVTTRPVTGTAPWLKTVIVYRSSSPGSTMPAVPPSANSATCFGANSSGRLPTTSRVGSSGIGVVGSSEGWSETPPAIALTKPWFEITVPSTTPGSTITSNAI